jgi:hypothetical protein
VDTLNINWITNQLALGGSFPPARIRELSGLGLSRVVDCRGEGCDDEAALRDEGLALLHLPAPDMLPLSEEQLERGAAWVNEQLEQGHRVLIHCEHGIGRSALLLCCVLVTRGEEPLAALARAKRARGCVSPSPYQLQAYLAFCQSWQAKLGAQWALPTLRQLMAVAYAHLNQRELG